MTDISTPEARTKLPVQGEPHWFLLAEGVKLGCRRNKRGDKWVAYHRPAGGKAERRRLAAVADMSYPDAIQAVYTWIESKRGPEAGRITVQQTISAYLDYLFNERAESSYEVAKKRAHRYILPSVGDMTVGDLTPDFINNWIRELPTGGKSQRARQVGADKVWAVLRAALYRLPSDHRPDAARFAEVKPYGAHTPPREVFLKEAEAVRWLNAASANLRPLLQFMLQTGARPGEARQIEVRDLDLDAGLWTVRKGKNQHRRDRLGLPPEVSTLDAATVALLRPLVSGKRAGDLVFLRAGRPWTKNMVAKDTKAAATRAGLDPATCAYTARHSFISWRIKAGVTLLALAQNLRTSVKEIEASYGKFDLRERRKLLDQGAVIFEVPSSNVVSMR